MSRVERSPVNIPTGVDVIVDGQTITVKGKQGSLHWDVDAMVKVKKEGATVKFSPENNDNSAIKVAGTVRAIVKNMLIGVSDGYRCKLVLEGVGYRAQAQGNMLNLSIGFSHPIKYELPPFVHVETPSQTEVVLRSIDKQLLGQVAAEIRDLQPPEPYKGKGIRYDGEIIVLKEGKKK